MALDKHKYKNFLRHDYPKKRIIIIGQSLSANLGDQAIYEALKQIISEKGHYEIAKYPIKATQFMNLRQRYSISWFIKIVRLLTIHIPIHYASLARIVRNSDLVIIGGGQLILDHSLLSPIQFLITSFIPKLLGKTLFICAIGAGPIRYRLSKILYRKAISFANQISVRDRYSLCTLVHDIKIKSNNVTLTADPAITLHSKSKKKNRTHSVVGISTMAFQFPNHNVRGVNEKYYKYVNDMHKLVDGLIETTVSRIILIPTEAPYDVEAMGDIYKKVRNKKNVELSSPANVDELIEIIRSCDVLIGTRMHSMLLALSHHIPIVGIAWHGKINSLFEAIGMRHLLFNIEEFQHETIIKFVKRILNNKKQYEKVIKNRVSGIQTLAKLNGALVDNLVGGT